MCNFAKGNTYDKEKATSFGVVERGCKEFAGIRQSEAVSTTGGEEAGAHTRRRVAEGDEAWDSVSVG
jgi:hypothetical protein